MARRYFPIAFLLLATPLIAQDDTATKRLTEQSRLFDEQIVQVADNVVSVLTSRALPAEELDGENPQVSAQRAYSCYFVGERGEGAAERRPTRRIRVLGRGGGLCRRILRSGSPCEHTCLQKDEQCDGLDAN